MEFHEIIASYIMSDDAVVTPSSVDTSVPSEGPSVTSVEAVSLIDLRILSPKGADIVLKSTPLSEGAANVLSGVLPLVQGFAEYTNVELVSGERCVRTEP